MSGKHLSYVVCFLNSSLSEYLFSKLGTTTGVGTVRWKKYTVEQLCIPAPNGDVESMLDSWFTSGNQSSTDLIAFRRDTDKLFFDICGLNDNERNFIQRFCRLLNKAE